MVRKATLDAELDFVQSEVLDDLVSFRDSLRDHISCLSKESYHVHLLSILDHHLTNTINDIK